MPGSCCDGVELGQVVVAAAGADAANGRQAIEKSFVDRAGVIVQPAGDRRRDFKRARPQRRRRWPCSTSVASSRRPAGLSHCQPQVCRAAWRIASLSPLISASCSTLSACSAVAPAVSAISAATFSRPILAELVERAQDGRRLVGQVQLFQQAAEHQPVVDVDRKISDAEGLEQVVDDQRRFDVGRQASWCRSCRNRTA